MYAVETGIRTSKRELWLGLQLGCNNLAWVIKSLLVFFFLIMKVYQIFGKDRCRGLG